MTTTTRYMRLSATIILDDDVEYNEAQLQRELGSALRQAATAHDAEAADFYIESE